MENYNKTKISSVIKQQLARLDIYSLLKINCPKDEFDVEAKMIVDRLEKGLRFTQIAKIISDVFCEMFDETFESNIFIESAKIIEIELNK